MIPLVKIQLPHLKCLVHAWRCQYRIKVTRLKTELENHWNDGIETSNRICWIINLERICTRRITSKKMFTLEWLCGELFLSIAVKYQNHWYRYVQGHCN
ncbi:hypothetical protein RRG08_037498 [Elysia crispata]|uniref:Uncharacterized protein n=1 Tax=Elysia crispata TaxID=231223 RepID=A0AAE1AZ00_9GAST|nr:hypothetical protein RRG08_037498 [Elysia crispata]